MITCQSVSRQHARLSVSDDSVELIDLNSRNGTFVENKAIHRGPVRAGQVIRFGVQEFVLEVLKGAEEAEEATARRPRELLREGPSISELTPGQRRVFHLLVRGLSEKQIARNLKISPHTVHAHVRAIYRHFGVHTRSELLVRSLGQDSG